MKLHISFWILYLSWVVLEVVGYQLWVVEVADLVDSAVHSVGLHSVAVQSVVLHLDDKVMKMHSKTKSRNVNECFVWNQLKTARFLFYLNECDAQNQNDDGRLGFHVESFNERFWTDYVLVFLLTGSLDVTSFGAGLSFYNPKNRRLQKIIDVINSKCTRTFLDLPPWECASDARLYANVWGTSRQFRKTSDAWQRKTLKRRWLCKDFQNSWIDVISMKKNKYFVGYNRKVDRYSTKTLNMSNQNILTLKMLN